MQQLLLELAPPPLPTLENFCPGRNGAALKALREALADGERFVFLWGPGGSGKTHLLRAFSGAAGVAKRDAAAVDDVARLGDAEQIALFDLCNRLRASGGALAASGEAPPARLALRPDLRSRLASLPTVGVAPPDDGLLEALLAKLFADRQLAVDRGTVIFIVARMERSFDAARRLVDAIDRAALASQRRPSLGLVREMMEALEGGA